MQMESQEQAPLCADPKAAPAPAPAALLGLQLSGRSVNHRGGLNHRPLSASRAFQTCPPHPSAHLMIKQSDPSQPKPHSGDPSPLSSPPSPISVPLICLSVSNWEPQTSESAVSN